MGLEGGERRRREAQDGRGEDIRGEERRGEERREEEGRGEKTGVSTTPMLVITGLAVSLRKHLSTE